MRQQRRPPDQRARETLLGRHQKRPTPSPAAIAQPNGTKTRPIQANDVPGPRRIAKPLPPWGQKLQRSEMRKQAEAGLHVSIHGTSFQRILSRGLGQLEPRVAAVEPEGGQRTTVEGIPGNPGFSDPRGLGFLVTPSFEPIRSLGQHSLGIEPKNALGHEALGRSSGE